MKTNDKFSRLVRNIALPVTLQSLLQSSFSVVDQIMVGGLGSTSIAGIGLGGKFASLYSVLISAIATVAGIMIAQYLGKRDDKEVSRSFFMNFLLSFLFSIIFLVICTLFSRQIMDIYTQDSNVHLAAVTYLSIIMFSFLPIAFNSLFSTLLRCMEAASLPLYASITGAIANTVLNYVLIYGKFGFPTLGITGAALATVISQLVTSVLIFILFLRYDKTYPIHLSFQIHMNKPQKKQYLSMLLPILICEFVWSLGENVYSAIYGNIGTAACAAMVLTSPVQGLFIGCLSGVSQAAGIIIGKALGAGDYDKAYSQSKKLIKYALYGSLLLSAMVIVTRRFYVRIYHVEDTVRNIACEILV